MRKDIFGGLVTATVFAFSGIAGAQECVEVKDCKDAMCEIVNSCKPTVKWHTRYACDESTGAVRAMHGKCACPNSYFVPVEQHGSKNWSQKRNGVTHYYVEKKVACAPDAKTFVEGLDSLIDAVNDALQNRVKPYIDRGDARNRKALADLREELEDKDAQDRAEKEMLVNLTRMYVRRLVWLARRNQVYPSVGVIGWGMDTSWIGGGFVGFAHRSWITPTLPLSLDAEVRMLYAPDFLSSGEDGFQNEIRGAAGWGASVQLRWEREKRGPSPTVALRGGPALYQLTHTERDGKPIGVYAGGELGIDVQLERTGSFEVRPFIGLGRIWYGGPGNGVFSGYSGISASWVF